MYRPHFTLSLLFALLSCAACSNAESFIPPKEDSSQEEENANKLDYNIFCFYYDWYGNEATDGTIKHWAHEIAPDPNGGGGSPGSISGTDGDIASNFYPQLGRYSSSDPEIVANHIDMFVTARIGVLALTWWNENTEAESKRINLILDEADKKDVKVCFHLEPYNGRNVENLRENMAKLIKQYGNHPAFYRKDGKPLFFVYDSYLIEASEWARLLTPNGDQTIRNTSLDSWMIGLWTSDPSEQEPFLQNGGFDGFYTYFASNGFTYGSTSTNWKSMQQWAQANGKLFIPSVGPGYIDTRIRPWNGSVMRDRNDGVYYDSMFRQAIESGVQDISITSFNEWHEGSQIEPAVPYSSPTFTYLDYGDLMPTYYLERTAYWVSEFEK